MHNGWDEPIENAIQERVANYVGRHGVTGV